MIMLGVVGCLAYQKYNKPVRECVSDMVEMEIDKANNMIKKMK